MSDEARTNGIGHATRNGHESTVAEDDRSTHVPGHQAPERGPSAESPFDQLTEVDQPTLPNNVHDVLKATDVWFEYGFNKLHTEAITGARIWAAAGLPRTDVDDDALPPELSLGQKGQALFSEWVNRVTNKMRSAVNGRVQRAGELLSNYEHDINELEKSLVDTDSVAQEMTRTEAASNGREAAINLRRFLSKRGFWLLMVILVCVDWVANVPVFHELLPQEAGSQQVLRGLIADTEGEGIWGGFHRMAIRLLFAPDVSLLAIGLIASLVFLAEVAGKSFRRLSVLISSDFPGAAKAVNAERRQFKLTAYASSFGVLCLLIVLVAARYQLSSATQGRVQAAELQITQLTENVAQARAERDPNAVFAAEQKLESARKSRDQRSERADYAATISAMNWPILFLNLVVALTAAIAGFLASADLISGNFEDPKLVGLRNRLLELKKALLDKKASLAQRDASISEQFSIASHLLQSQAFASSSAKANRIRSLIPAFRAENSQLRGIDPINIASFRKQFVFEFPPVTVAIVEPGDLPLYRARFESLKARAAELISRVNAETRSAVIV